MPDKMPVGMLSFVPECHVVNEIPQRYRLANNVTSIKAAICSLHLAVVG